MCGQVGASRTFAGLLREHGRSSQRGKKGARTFLIQTGGLRSTIPADTSQRNASTHVPTLTGGTGCSEVERFYRERFIGHWPDDVQVKSVSRTVGQSQVVDELIVSLTHDREMRVYLPGVAPTGRKVVLPHVVVMGFDEGGRIAHDLLGSGIAASAGWIT